MSSLKFESLKDDFEALSAQIDQTGISAGAIQRLNRILTSLESEGKVPKRFRKVVISMENFRIFLAHSAPERYKMGMIEDVDDYRKQLKAYNAEAVGMGIG